MKSIFTDCYLNNSWKSTESRSGPGHTYQEQKI